MDIRDEYSGVLTGKGLEFGGSLARTRHTEKEKYQLFADISLFFIRGADRI